MIVESILETKYIRIEPEYTYPRLRNMVMITPLLPCYSDILKLRIAIYNLGEKRQL